MEARTFGPLPVYFSSLNQAFTDKVLDPILIKLRGSPCKNRPKAWNERFNSRDKGNCVMNIKYISFIFFLCFSKHIIYCLFLFIKQEFSDGLHGMSAAATRYASACYFSRSWYKT
jgi:hypothetical protein